MLLTRSPSAHTGQAQRQTSQGLKPESVVLTRI